MNNDLKSSYNSKTCHVLFYTEKPLKIEAGKFHLTFDIRPQDLTGVLFYARGHGSQRISVHLQNDKVGVLGRLMCRPGRSGTRNSRSYTDNISLTE